MTTQTPLTLDHLRIDIANVLGESPADIGDDDNLMDLGLDSMRMLGLVMAWGKTGLPLEFSHLAEYTTLAGWWQVISAMQTESKA